MRERTFRAPLGVAGRDVQDAVGNRDLAAGQIGVAVEAGQFGLGHQICCGQDDFQPGMREALAPASRVSDRPCSAGTWGLQAIWG